MLTFKCPVACPHCIVDAGPHRTEEMSLDDAYDWIRQASRYRGGHIRCLALTGGEPFVDLTRLARVSTYGRTLGFVVSAVTNAFWASTLEAALSVLSAVPAVRMISISTDSYHQRSIPFHYVENALQAARQLGCMYNVAICTDREDDPKYQEIIQKLEAIGEADKIRPAIAFPVGRGQKNARHSTYHLVPEPTTSACVMASMPVVFPNGKVIGCIGPLLTLRHKHPLFLGNLRQEMLSEILDRSELNLVLHVVRVWGPQKLVFLLRESGQGTLLPKEYIQNCSCDVCYKLLSNQRIVDALRNILQEDDLPATIAYARLHYLNETTMAERLHLEASDSASNTITAA